MDTHCETSNGPVYKTMKMIHLALCLGVLIFSIIAFVITKETKFDFSYENDIMILVVPILAISSFFISQFIFNKSLEETTTKDTSIDFRLKKYQTAMLLSLVVPEGVALLAIVWFITSQNLFFLLIGVLVLMYMISLYPSLHKISEKTQMSETEKREFK